MSAVALAVFAGSGAAESVSASAATSSSSPTRSDRSIEYHGGAVMYYAADVYLIWYGCWGLAGCAPGPDDTGTYTQTIVTDFASNVGRLGAFARIRSENSDTQAVSLALLRLPPGFLSGPMDGFVVRLQRVQLLQNVCGKTFAASTLVGQQFVEVTHGGVTIGPACSEPVGDTRQLRAQRAWLQR